MTIDMELYAIVVHDADGAVVHRERTTCRPGAYERAVDWAERHGAIDWDRSDYERCEAAPADEE